MRIVIEIEDNTFNIREYEQLAKDVIAVADYRTTQRHHATYRVKRED